MTTIEAIGHAASIFFAIGFCLFLWQITKGVRKLRKRARKAGKRYKKAGKRYKKAVRNSLDF